MSTPQPHDLERSAEPSRAIGLRLAVALLALAAGMTAVVLAVLLVRSALG